MNLHIFDDDGNLLFFLDDLSQFELLAVERLFEESRG